MNKNRVILYVCFLMIAFSCNMDNSGQDNADAPLCNIKGNMIYNSAFHRWEIHRFVSDDLIEFYVVRDYKIDTPKDEEYVSKNVEATGVCTQSDEIPYAIHDDLPPISETVPYYIDIKNLKYE
jgi:hypothetical protein